MPSRLVLLFCLVLLSTTLTLGWTGEEAKPQSASQDIAAQRDSESLRLEGDQALQAKDWAKAVQIWTQVLASQPGDIEALLVRAHANSEQGQHALALEDDKKATELSPEHGDAWTSYCFHQITAGEWGSSRPICERSHALAPESMATTANLGHTYFLQGDRATAQQWYDKTLPLLESDEDLAAVVGDFDLFIQRGWQAEAAKQVRAWFAEQGGQWLQGTRLNQQMLDLYGQGKVAEAFIIARQVLSDREKLLGPGHPAVADSLDNLAVLHAEQGQYAQAESFYQRALSIREKALGSEHAEVATSLNNLALLYQQQGQFAQAEPLQQRVLTILEKTLGPEHIEVASSLNELAAMYQEQDRYATAEPLYQRALAIREKALGQEHPDVAQSLNNLATLYFDQGRHGAAEPLYQRALAIWEKVLGPGHPEVAIGLDNLAALYHDQGQYERAEPLYKRALEIREKALGPRHPDVIASLSNLARLYEDQGKTAEAESLYQRATSIKEKDSGEESAKHR
jgi:tetratricopeptide (TPR) repeat protein